MFESDAEQGAALLGITLTKRHDMPMAGIPSHAAESYLSKLAQEKSSHLRPTGASQARQVGKAGYNSNSYSWHRAGREAARSLP